MFFRDFIRKYIARRFEPTDLVHRELLPSGKHVYLLVERKPCMKCGQACSGHCLTVQSTGTDAMVKKYPTLNCFSPEMALPKLRYDYCSRLDLCPECLRKE
jgi:hypothetical protein